VADSYLLYNAVLSKYLARKFSQTIIELFVSQFECIQIN